MENWPKGGKGKRNIPKKFMRLSNVLPFSYKEVSIGTVTQHAVPDFSMFMESEKNPSPSCFPGFLAEVFCFVYGELLDPAAIEINPLLRSLLLLFCSH